jgi:hypothetical protein
MQVLTATGSWLFDFLLTFSLRMRAVWRHGVFRRRVIYIHQKNGAATLYTPRTGKSSGDLLLTNEELPRVASRRREVGILRHTPFSFRG